MKSELKILVIDDDPSICKVILRFLEKDMHLVETACDGQEGIEKFLAANFDLVITDMSMPGMKVDQVAEKIKHIAPSKPIILLTGYGDIINVPGKRPPMVDMILPKPLARKQLQDAISQLMDKDDDYILSL